MAGVVNIQTGSPFSVYDCVNGFSTCTRVLVDGNTDYSGSLGASTGDPNRFVWNPLTGLTSIPLDPANPNDIFPGENGFLPDTMSKRNAFRGAGFWNADMSLSKKFFFTEKMNLQVRVDAQNVFNHANTFVNVGSADISGFFGDGPNVTASKFGRRQIQFGARFSF